MAVSFGLGSACFLIGPLPSYVSLVGTTGDAVTSFVGSVLFTAGGAVQTWMTSGGRRGSGASRAAWWAAVIQSAGTLFFNVSTLRAIQVTAANPHYDRLVWRPDLFGSACFLISGAITYRSAPRPGWQPAVNLLGCVCFGVAGVAGYVLPATGSMVNEAVATVGTCAGATCFLVCALGALGPAPRGA
jgi:hypothetical protein